MNLILDEILSPKIFYCVKLRMNAGRWFDQLISVSLFEGWLGTGSWMEGEG